MNRHAQILHPSYLRYSLAILAAASFCASVWAEEIEWRVVDTKGAPVAGATVRLDPQTASRAYNTTTDASGVILLPQGIEGSYTIHVEAKGFGLVNSGPHTFSSQVKGLRGGLIQIAREGTVGGTVSVDGAPIAGAKVYLSGQVAMTTYSDASGRYRIGGLPPGGYWLRADHVRYVTEASKSIVVREGEATEVPLSLRRGLAIVGKVHAADGKPLGRISIYTSDGPGYGWGNSKLDGSFRLERLLPGDYRVHLYGDGVRETSVDVRLGASPAALDVTMEPLPPSIQAFSNRNVFRRGEKACISVRAFRVDAIHLDVYALAKDSVLEGQGRLRIPKAIPDGAKPVYAKEIPIAYERPYSWRHMELPLPVTAPGFYLVSVSGPGRPTLIPIAVSDLGLVVKRSPSEVLTWAIHLGTGAPYEGARIRVTSAGSVFADGKGNADGLLRASVTVPVAVTVTADAGPEIASVPAPLSADASSRLKAYIYTDRPVYRPGQQVFWKAIVRRETDDGHAVPSGEPVKVRVRDALGQSISESTAMLTDMGVATGNLELAAEPPLGLYQVEVESAGETATGSFKVYEYRKPEFAVEIEADRPQYAPGDSVSLTIRGHYHFGAPLANVNATWTVYATPYFRDADLYEWGGQYYDAGYGQLVASNTATLGPDGQGVARFVVPDLAMGDMRLSIEAVVTDQSNRSVTGRASVIGARGDFTLQARAGSWVLEPGSPATLIARAMTFDDRPVSTSIEFEVRRREWSTEARAWKDGVALRETAHTDPDGTASVTTPPLQEGYYSVTATAHDDHGRAIPAKAWFWVAGRSFGGFAEQVGALEIVADKPSYRPGDRARVLIHGIPDGGSVLVTTEREHIQTAEVHRVKGSVLVVDLPISEADAPNVYVAASTVDKSIHKVRAVSLKVDSSARALSIKIAPDRPSYRPGDRTTVDLEVTDGYGRPVAAEVSLGVVDEAIYQISEELCPDIFRFFHGLRPNRVTTVYSFAERRLGGADKDARSRARRNFKDTAFWAPSLRTDSSGRARVSFDWPDNLTTWRFTARAATRDTAVGAAVVKALVTKELVTRIHAPRFLVSGDTVSVSVVVNDRAARERRALVTLEVEGNAKADGARTQERTMAPSAEERFEWTLHVTAPGAVRLRARVKDEARASARAEDNEDSMETTLPALAFGRPFSVVANGSVGEGSDQSQALVAIPAGAVPQSIQSAVQLDPGVASAAFGSLDDLIGYPYGCAEQTMSRFLPTVMAVQASRGMGLSLGPKASEVPRMVAQGTSKLYGYQHKDGGWGWWVDDETHPYMTAYVTWGLLNAREAGFPIDSDRIERGLASTKAQLEKAGDPNVKAFMLYALAAGRSADRNTAAALFAERAKLSDYGRGLLLSVLAKAGERERAQQLRAELEAHANLGGASPATASGAFWEAATWNEGWMRNPVEATAYALRGIVAVEPSAPLASRAARWLVLNRKGTSWHTTKDSAAAVYALLDYAKGAEPEPDARVTIKLDGRATQSLSFKGYDSLVGHPPLAIPAASLSAGTHRLSIERQGQGRIFYSARISGVVAQESIAPEGTQLRVERRYFTAEQVPEGPGRIRIERQPLMGPVPAGTLLQCELRITAAEETDFVMVEDPLPSGCEVVSEPEPPKVAVCEECEEDFETDRPYDRREDRDEKVAFFKSKLPKGTWTLTYLMKAETPGSFRVLPARVEAMYVPGVDGHGSSDRLQVLPR